ncbi:MAG TPA: DMT family transporter [Gemmatimonadales bacterium]|nr:DMT family transporter [Gemmatimonadales bacterium]
MNTTSSDAGARSTGLLLLATLAWGLSFVVVKQALTASTPLAFTAIRFGIGAALLVPFADWARGVTASEFRAGLVLGGLLAVGFATQTIGLLYTTPARSAFLVASSAVLAPLLAAALERHRPAARLLIALGIAAVGIYLLTAPQGGGLNRGDIWTLGTAVSFAAQIVAVTRLSRQHDPARLAWLETVGTALGVALATLLFESPRIRWSPGFDLLLAYAALPATALALWWQLIAQRRMSTAKAAMVLCLEPAFAALASWVWLGERLSVAQWVGGALIVIGMLTTEFGPLPRR